MLSVFDDITKKEKRGQQQLTMAIYPFQYPDYATLWLRIHPNNLPDVAPKIDFWRFNRNFYFLRRSNNFCRLKRSYLVHDFAIISSTYTYIFLCIMSWNKVWSLLPYLVRSHLRSSGRTAWLCSRREAPLSDMVMNDIFSRSSSAIWI